MRALVPFALLAACTSTAVDPAPPDATTIPARDAGMMGDAGPGPDVVTTPDALARDVPAPRDVAPSLPRCPDGVAMPYPEDASLAEGSALPGYRFATETGSLDLRAYYTPCNAAPDLLVVRVMAAWSGHARWHAAHTVSLRRSALGARVKVLDLLVLDAQNRPAEPAALAEWRAQYDAPPDALAVDPGYTLKPLYLAAARPPMVLYLDPRTMTVLRVEESPNLDEVGESLAGFAARYAGVARSPAPPPPRVDDRFTPDEWSFLRTMTPLGPPPADPTNRFADDPRAAALGQRLFRDPGFSSNEAVACSTCHAEERDYGDGRATAMGLQRGERNTPSVRLAPWHRWQFWDGRADSLWSQALGPIENPEEMNGSRLALAHRLATEYRTPYEAIFGALPALGDTARFPARGRPGDPAWEAMAEPDREAVNRVFVNFGKALAAYERSLAPRPTAFDRYLGGDFAAMSPEARTGLRRYLDAGCAQCHFGPALTNDSFHNIGMPTGRGDGIPDQGRYAGVRPLLASAFRADGPFSDDRSVAAHLRGLVRTDAMEGMFRTPTLRNVARTGPWGHGGNFASLEDVVRHYADAALGHHRESSTAGTIDAHLVGFHRDSATAASIAELLRAMSD